MALIEFTQGGINAAANAIPHAGTLTLPQAMEYAAGGAFNVEAYGASIAASAAVNTAAFQAAYAAAFASTTGGTVILQPGKYAVNSLDFSQGASQDLTKHVRILGANSQASILEFDTSGVCIDALSVDGLQIENVTITNKAGSTPTIGLLLARTSTAQNCRYGSFRNLRIDGSFSQACVASIASEIQYWDNCYFQNNYVTGVAFASSTQPTMMKADGAGGWASFTVSSANGTILTSSNTDITFVKCCFFTSGAYGIPMTIEAGMNATFVGCDFDPWGATAQACVLLSAEVNDIFAGPLVFTGCLFESDDAHGIVFLAQTGSNPKIFRFVKAVNCNFNLYNSVNTQYSLTWAGDLTDQAVVLFGSTYRDNSRPVLENDIVRVNYIQDTDVSLPAGTIAIANNGTSSGAIVRGLVVAKVWRYDSGADQVNVVDSQRYFYAASKPNTGGYVKGDIIWNSSPDQGDPVGWICRVSGGLYSHARGDTTPYSVGDWLIILAEPYSIWEVTAGTGNSGSSPPSQVGAVGSTVVDGDLTLTKRAGTAAYVGEFGRQVGYRSGAATPAGSVTPTHVGEEYLDSTAGVWYKSKDLANTDWVALN